MIEYKLELPTHCLDNDCRMSSIFDASSIFFVFWFWHRVEWSGEWLMKEEENGGIRVSVQ